MKSTIFWDITPYSPLKVNRRFGGTWHPSSGSKKKPSKKQRGNHSSTFPLVPCSAYSSTLKMEAICSPKRRLTFNGQHGVISQKIVLFITTAVKTSNLYILLILIDVTERRKTIGSAEEHQAFQGRPSRNHSSDQNNVRLRVESYGTDRRAAVNGRKHITIEGMHIQ
jgi:hypothetical protein